MGNEHNLLWLLGEDCDDYCMNQSADCTMLFAGGSGSSWRKWIVALCLLLANIAMLVLLLALRPILLSNPLSTMNLTSTSNASEWPSLALNYSIIPETKTSLATCAAAAVKVGTLFENLSSDLQRLIYCGFCFNDSDTPAICPIRKNEMRFYGPRPWEMSNCSL